MLVGSGEKRLVVRGVPEIMQMQVPHPVRVLHYYRRFLKTGLCVMARVPGQKYIIKQKQLFQSLSDSRDMERPRIFNTQPHSGTAGEFTQL